MTTIKLPYGRTTLPVEIPEERLEAVLVSRAHEYYGEGSETELVEKAMANPIESPRLRELARNKDKIVIISSDHTRPVPSHITMPVLLKEIRQGNPEARITILVATGYHRATTEAELRNKYGDEIVDRENIIIHNCFDSSSTVKIGLLPSGGDLIINKLAVTADLLVAEGFIEPHFFAGFSGGRKSVLPGIASDKTILANHCAAFIHHPRARTGILENNPIHVDMVYAAKMVKLAFILNVVIDGEKKVIQAFAGHFDKAHLKGCEFVQELAGVKVRPAEIVITTNGGYPLDQNIYQTVKGLTAAEATCKKGGVIIAVSQCADGHGGEGFYRTFCDEKNLNILMEEILKRTPGETVPDQWESQILARILLKHPVIMVTGAPREMVENMHMKWAPDIKTALEMADAIIGNKKAKITIIPDGVSVIVKE